MEIDKKKCVIRFDITFQTLFELENIRFVITFQPLLSNVLFYVEEKREDLLSLKADKWQKEGERLSISYTHCRLYTSDEKLYGVI